MAQKDGGPHAWKLMNIPKYAMKTTFTGPVNNILIEDLCRPSSLDTYIISHINHFCK